LFHDLFFFSLLVQKKVDLAIEFGKLSFFYFSSSKKLKRNLHIFHTHVNNSCLLIDESDILQEKCSIVL